MLGEMMVPITAFWTGTLAVANATVDSQTTTTPFDLFLQYGVLGLVVIGFITGWIVPGYHQKQLLADNQRLTALVEGKLFPMLETTGTTLTQAARAMEQQTAAFTRWSDDMNRGQRPGAGT